VLFHRQQRVQRHSQVTNVVERTDVDTDMQMNIADFVQLQCWSQPDELFCRRSTSGDLMTSNTRFHQCTAEVVWQWSAHRRQNSLHRAVYRLHNNELRRRAHVLWYQRPPCTVGTTEVIRRSPEEDHIVAECKLTSLLGTRPPECGSSGTS